MESKPHGLVDNWLRHVRDIYQRNSSELEAISSETERIRRLCELNVIDQVVNVGNTTIIQDAWERGQKTAIHGWIYDLSDGLLKNLNVCITSRNALEALQRKP